MVKFQSGFTLVELMVVVVIISILFGIGIPGYRNYVMRANRVDATAALLRIAAAQEKYYLQRNPAQYASTPAELSDPPPGGLGIGVTDRGFYNLAVVAGLGPGGAATGFIASAIVAAGEDQASDSDCILFRINAQGQRSAENTGGADTTAICWR